MKIMLPALTLFALLSACASSVRSTVDGYGEVPLSAEAPLYFDRESLPLAERPVADSCRDAAKNLRLNISEKPCSACHRVEVRSKLAGTTQAIRSGGPTLGTSFGLLGGASGFGLGVGTGNTRSEEHAERVIEIGIFEGQTKSLARAITARSVGREISVPAVAYENVYRRLPRFSAELEG